MASLTSKTGAERRVRHLLEEHGLPQPDCVEYGHTCIRLFWHDTKTVVVIDIDGPEDLEESSAAEAASANDRGGPGTQ